MTTPLIEACARAIFDGRPHNHWIKGVRQIPDWDLQPEDLKEVFRKDARAVIPLVLYAAAEVAESYNTGAGIKADIAAIHIADRILAIKPEAQS